ncbi:MAG TPA: GNAT family N-acetyltransferase [Blastocatellia bacterium]|jgi:ribosomal-protein-alanine N-acetyltransferase
MTFPVIETSRLELRPLTADDVDDIHRLWIHPDVRKYLWDDEVISREQAAGVVVESSALFRTRGFGLWRAAGRGNESLIGFCGYWFFQDPPQLQLLYGVAPTDWGRGLATELARAAIRYGFEEMAFDRVIASADAPNLASLRVMQKAGMAFDRRVSVNGLDTVYYIISREEFHAGDSYFKVR